MPDHVLRIDCATISGDYLTLDTTPDAPDAPLIAAITARQGSTGAQVNLSPETARTLAEALIAWADDPPVRRVAHDRNNAEILPGDRVVIWLPDRDEVFGVARWTGEFDRDGRLSLEVEAHRSTSLPLTGTWNARVLTKVVA